LVKIVKLPHEKLTYLLKTLAVAKFIRRIVRLGVANCYSTEFRT